MTTTAGPGSAGGQRARSHVDAELDRLRLQVEVMAVRVAEQAPEVPLPVADTQLFRTLGDMAEVAQDLYRSALVRELLTGDPARLTAEVR